MSFAERRFLPEAFCRDRWLFDKPAFVHDQRDRKAQKARRRRRAGLKWREVAARLGCSLGHARELAESADFEDRYRLGFEPEGMDLWHGIRAMAAVERLVELCRRRRRGG